MTVSIPPCSLLYMLGGFLKKLSQKKDRIVSVDFGSSGLKVVSARLQDRVIEINHITIANYASEKISSIIEVIENPRLGHLVDIVWNYIPRGGGRICFIIPGRFVIVKKFTLPATVSDVESYLQDRIKEELPFSLSEISFDFYTLPSEGELGVVCIVARRDILKRCSSLLAETSYKVTYIDTAFSSLANLYNYNYPEETEKFVAIVDMGRVMTNVAFLKNGHLVFGQCLSEVQGGLLDRTIAHRMGITPEEAEERKINSAVPEDVLREALEEFCQDLTGQLWILAERAEFPRIDKIYLTGGNAALYTLKETLKNQMNCNVELLSPLKRFRISKEIDRVYLEEVSDRLSLALGGIVSSLQE